MSTMRYLEFSSTYRDRNQYPSPASFVVEISQSGQKSRAYAKDPVSDSSPIHYWNNSFAENAAVFEITGLTVDLTYSLTTNSRLAIESPVNELRQINNFYTGAVFVFTTGGTISRHRITNYEYLSNNYGIIEVEPSFATTTDFGAGTGVIQNPTPFNTTTANAVIQFFIPAGVSINNAYVDYYIDLISSPGGINTLESRKITAYNGTTHLATLESATTNNWRNTGIPAQANSNFALRRELPCNEGDILGISTDGRIIQLALSASSETGRYIGSFIRMVEPVPIAGAVPNGFTNNIEPYAEERRIVNYIADSGTFTAFGGAGNSTFTLSNNANTTNDYYVNQFITTNAGNTFLITSYNGSTKQGSIAPSVWTAAAVSWTIRTITLQNQFSINPTIAAGNNGYEIECFTNDNWTPFDYTGSLVSSQQSCCYEIELVNLILPNSLLKSGSRAIFYPFVYVELDNISAATSGSRSSIYSNNPNSTRMLFRALLDDTVLPTSSPFIKVDSDGMTQTIKFKPNDSFKFGVYLPDGRLFETVAQDTTCPTQPSVLVQISALFSFKRV